VIDDQLVTHGATIVATVMVSILMDKRDKRHTDQKIESQEHRINLLFDYKDIHEKESSAVRFSLSKEISELAATVKVNQSQYAEILRRLDALDRKIDKREDSKRKGD